MDRLFYGTRKLSLIDRYGKWLSCRAIQRAIGKKSAISVLGSGCGYKASNLLALKNNAYKLTGCDYNIDPVVKEMKIFWVKSILKDCNR